MCKTLNYVILFYVNRNAYFSRFPQCALTATAFAMIRIDEFFFIITFIREYVMWKFVYCVRVFYTVLLWWKQSTLYVYKYYYNTTTHCIYVFLYIMRVCVGAWKLVLLKWNLAFKKITQRCKKYFMHISFFLLFKYYSHIFLVVLMLHIKDRYLYLF